MKSDCWHFVAGMYQMKKHPVDMCASAHEAVLLTCCSMSVSLEQPPLVYLISVVDVELLVCACL